MSHAKDRSALQWRAATVAALLLAFVSGCGERVSTEPPATSFDPALAAHLQAQLDQSREQNLALGAVAGVQSADGAVWVGASGSATADQTVALRTTDRFRVASITKLFTATLILQLVEEQRLRLEDTLDAWYPSLPSAGQITIRMLLTHTSGIADDGTVNQHAHWEPDAVIDAVVKEGLLYPPGSQFTYSDTNYFLLGRIIEKITAASYLHELRGRLLGPLGLDQTFLEGEEEIPGGFVQGARRSGSTFVDITNTIDPSLLWAAGGLVSTAADMLRFSRALFGGRVIRPDSLAAMTAPAALNDGSQIRDAGIMDILDTPAGARYGHYGHTNGFASSLFFLPDRQLASVVLSNDNRLVAFVIAGDIWLLLTPG